MRSNYPHIVLAALAAIGLLALCLAPATAAVTIHVDCTNTSGIEDGSEAHPYDTIQEGVNAAHHGDTVLVHPCAYFESIDFLGKAITVTGTDPLDPAVVDATVIDGGGVGSVVTFANGEGAGSVLTGFTVTNGGGEEGGGIHCDYSSPTITHNTISDNHARQGAGIYCVNSSPTIEGNTITDNSWSGDGAYGAGIYCHISSPTITDNTISENSAYSEPNYGYFLGGGIYCYDSSPVITENIISDNKADGWRQVSVILWERTGRGGGIYCQSCPPTIVISDNAITGNDVNDHGAGVYWSGDLLDLSTCVIADNTREEGVYCLGSLTLSNCMITGNSGTGIYWSESLTATNCTIADNGDDLLGEPDNSSATLCNCIVWPETISVQTLDVTYSDVNTATGAPWPGDGNICLDPAFDAGYHLRRHSPCVDAGLNACAPADDIDGDPRPLPLGGQVDMGADEHVDPPVLPACVARDVYVDAANTSGIEDGTQEHPYNTIQEGIDAVCDSYSVVVNQGTYQENILFRGKAITVTSTGPLDPAVVGGTVIDGGSAGSVVTFAHGEGADSVLDGFTVTNGSAHQRGGGIYCGPLSSPVIRNSQITGNSVSGLYCQYNSSPTISDNVITGNNAQEGGGIHCDYSSPTITHNTISDNHARQGAGIYCVNSSPTIEGNTITDNSWSGDGAYGAGIYCHTSSPTITYNRISGNSAYSEPNYGYFLGGGIYCYDSSPVITENIISDNKADGWRRVGIRWERTGRGGGIYCQSCPPTIVISDNAITGNDVNDHGAGVYWSGDLLDLSTCVIADNTREEGVYCLGSLTLSNCVITGNSGTGIYWSESLTATNCTIAHNGDDLLGEPDNSSATLCNCIVWPETISVQTLDVTYSDVCTGTGGPWPGKGNICADPLLTEDGHLMECSPCINAGWNDAPGLPLTDMDGDPRPLPAGGAVDIGADEYAGLTACFSYAPPEPDDQSPVQFTDCSSDAYGQVISWTWDFGDGGTSTEPNPNHLFAAGTCQVCLTVTNDDTPPRPSTCCQTLVISENVPECCFNYAPANPDDQTPVEFSDCSTDAYHQIVAWFWDFGDGQDSTEQNPSHLFATGTYQVCLTVTNDAVPPESSTCCQTVDVIHLYPPECSFTHDPASPLTQEPVQFIDESIDPDGAIVAWDWDFGDGGMSTDQHPTHTYTSGGCFEVTLTVTDSEGLSNTCSTCVPVRSETEVPLCKAGWHLIAQPHSGDHALADIVVRDDWNDLALPFCDAVGSLVMNPLFYYDPDSMGYLLCGCEGVAPPSQDHTMRMGHGYWLYTFQDYLRLVFP